MPRRASLPGADLLFGSTAAPPRSTRKGDVPGEAAPVAASAPAAEPAPAPLKTAPAETVPVPESAPSPGVSGERTARPRSPRHDEKITVYCTDSDLTRLEAARLSLRAHYRLPSDRGRIVRAAIAEILDDFDARGADSSLVKRLSSQ